MGRGGGGGGARTGAALSPGGNGPIRTTRPHARQRYARSGQGTGGSAHFSLPCEKQNARREGEGASSGCVPPSPPHHGRNPFPNPNPSPPSLLALQTPSTRPPAPLCCHRGPLAAAACPGASPTAFQIDPSYRPLIKPTGPPTYHCIHHRYRHRHPITIAFSRGRDPLRPLRIY